MHKIWIILKSEFLRRVKSKWFVVATLVGPVILVAVMVLPAVLGILASGSDEKAIAVVDETGVLLERMQAEAEDQYRFVAAEAPLDSLRAAVEAGTYDGYLVLPGDVLTGAGAATYYSVEGGGLSFGERLERLVSRAVEAERLEARQVDAEVLEILETSVPMRMVKLTDEGEAADDTIAYVLVGYIMGFFIYFAMFFYGAFVMNGVIEEKTSRVVEVMVSSVRPFQLLMGKVLGIGAMGLVQMAAWAVLILLLLTFSGSIASLFLNPADFNLPAQASQEEVLAAADFSVPEIEPGLFVWFLLFFLGGYLLYASLFAAVGSAVEQQQDAQGLMMPITLLILVPIIFITFIVESPNTTLSVVLSLIPFFSPILMVVRAAVTDVPFWEIALSYLLLIGGFLGAIWLSARIYRVGILMYGKKPSLRELARWVRYA